MKMKKLWLKTLFILLFLSVSITQSGWCGQVVVPELREWAKKALKEEKTLETVKGRNSIAILYFQNKTGDSGLDLLQKGLAFMLITDLSKLERLQVVERARLQALTEEMGFGVSGLVDPDTSPRMGRLVGAQWIAGGDILARGDVPIHVESNLLDVPGPYILGQPAAEGMLEQLFRIEKDLLFEIIDLLKIQLTPEERAELEKPISMDIEALFDLFRGLNASDEGDYEQAEAYYDSAINRDPGMTAAWESLNELRSLGLIRPMRKESRQLLHTLRQETSLTDTITTNETTRREEGPESGTTSVPVTVPVPQL